MTATLAEPEFAVHYYSCVEHRHVDVACPSLLAAQARRREVRQHQDASALLFYRTDSGPYELYQGGAA
jgi:hypothetical protein